MQGSDVHPRELFPFPPETCGEMNLLEVVTSPSPQLTTDELPTLAADEKTGDVFSGYSFLDLFELDFATIDLMEDLNATSYAAYGGSSYDSLS
jgi:hypothetical protein